MELVILHTWYLVHHSSYACLVLLDYTNDLLDHIRKGSWSMPASDLADMSEQQVGLQLFLSAIKQPLTY